MNAYNRDLAINAENEKRFEPIDPAKWYVLESGEGVTLLASGSMVKATRQALPALKEQGINPTLINARPAKPLDTALLQEVISEPYGKMVTSEEGCLSGGFGAAVLEWAARFRLTQPGARQSEIACIGIPDRFVEQGSRSILLDANGLSPGEDSAVRLRVCPFRQLAR